MKRTGNIQKIQNIIDKSLIYCILINPSSYFAFSHHLTYSIPAYQSANFPEFHDDFFYLLIKMNPLLEDITKGEEKFQDEEEKLQDEELNLIFQKDNYEELKLKLINHLLNPNHKDGKGISLIEKCTFFDSKKCINFLLEENITIERRSVRIDDKDYEIGLMEYGALKGNKDIINICLEKGQIIQPITLELGLIGHHNEIVEWMIEEGKRKEFFDETIKNGIFGNIDNIEFNEKLLKSGADLNAKDSSNYKRRRYKEIQH